MKIERILTRLGDAVWKIHFLLAAGLVFFAAYLRVMVDPSPDRQVGIYACLVVAAFWIALGWGIKAALQGSLSRTQKLSKQV